jgi:thioredoxin-related protein
MKKILCLISFLFIFSIYGIAQDGVVFENLTLEQAMAKAKETNKLVFADCYTSWCGPCKKLSSDIFPQKIVGDYINERFVCVKFDVEKEEYKYIAKQYDIRAYPTMLIIGTDGKLVDRVLGYQAADKLINAIESSFDKGKSLMGLREKYMSGDTSKLVLTQYFAKIKTDGSLEADEVGEKLYQSLSDEEKLSATYWYFYSNEKFTPDNSPRMEFIKKNYKALCKNVGTEKVDRILTRNYQNNMKNAISANPAISKKELNTLKKEFSSFSFACQNDLLSMWNLANAAQNKNVTGLINASEKEFKFLCSNTNTNFWGVITDVIRKNGTQDEKREWASFCEKIKEKATDSTYLMVLAATVDLLRK